MPTTPKKITVIGLKKLEYADVPATGLPTVWTPVDVVHEDTFNYEQAENTVEPYINELDGEAYAQMVTKRGERTINFSIGLYDLPLRAKFMGGTYTAAAAGKPAKWVPSTTLTPIYMALRATALDDSTVTFPKAFISAITKANKKAYGIMIKGIANKPNDASLGVEIWEDGDTSVV